MMTCVQLVSIVDFAELDSRRGRDGCRLSLSLVEHQNHDDDQQQQKNAPDDDACDCSSSESSFGDFRFRLDLLDRLNGCLKLFRLDLDILDGQRLFRLLLQTLLEVVHGFGGVDFDRGIERNRTADDV